MKFKLPKLFHIHKWVRVVELEDYKYKGSIIQRCKPTDNMRYCKECEAVQIEKLSSQGSSWHNLSNQEQEVMLDIIKTQGDEQGIGIVIPTI